MDSLPRILETIANLEAGLLRLDRDLPAIITEAHHRLSAGASEVAHLEVSGIISWRGINERYRRSIEMLPPAPEGGDWALEKARIILWVALRTRGGADFVIGLNLRWSGRWRSGGQASWIALLAEAENLVALVGGDVRVLAGILLRAHQMPVP